MNILIVKLSALGDIIHTLPALARLRRAFPQARIFWVVERTMAQLLRDHPMLEGVIEVDTRKWRKHWLARATWGELRDALTHLRRHRYDLGFDFQGLMKSGLVLWLSGAERRIGFESAALKERASRLFLTEQVAVPTDAHVIEQNLTLVRYVAGGSDDRSSYEFPLWISERDRRTVEEHLEALGLRDFALLNPGAGWAAKRWPPERYGAVADFLWERYGWISLVSFGPSEEALAQAVARASRWKKAVPFPCTLPQLAVLADRARLFLGGDTGPLHLAAARGTPIVALYGPTSARRNGPFHPDDQVIERTPASGYRYYSRRQRDVGFLDIPVEEVIAAIERRVALAEKAHAPAGRRTSGDS
ncbi:MAG: lipopolysaccharide heptosyltransferase I [Blastocatellia bacterium]|nr:lipopolysaccharide heptosyltransferase I [Blastocatellia bacterium]MCS7156992.1 lipopolysaccharide heptosyltransferase I [Blastocatellia bacterium]MCX7752193.1 lipopolysaccharide heptosyltransferase I [Blastocatellia bacterium]MDW8167685.1 lipopolysaccharide heptosyltransferase I [Acidobacteriota bacterium]MDW8256284.1 lipopolysaccharide heptosyltransferase I [Acidobacteriota bacterium]